MKTDIMRIRVPAEAKAWLRARAAENDRSMNYVIVKLIEAAQERAAKPTEIKQ